jgi:hypothetical protein
VNNNEYFSLIAYFCLFNEDLKLKVKKKLLKHVYKGISKIKLEAKEIILKKLP